MHTGSVNEYRRGEQNAEANQARWQLSDHDDGRQYEHARPHPTKRCRMAVIESVA